MAEPRPQWAPEGTAGLAAVGRATKSPCKNPPTPGSRSGGVRSSAPAAEDLGGRGVCESPDRERGPPRGHPRALGPRSGHQPADPRRAPAGPQQFSPPPHFNKQEISRPKRPRPASRCTPRQVHPTRVPARVLSPGPHAAPAGHPRPTPRPNLLVRVCFFGHFPVHLDACPAAGSFAPFIFLSAHPPSSHLRRSPDLVGGSC